MMLTKARIERKAPAASTRNTSVKGLAALLVIGLFALLTFYSQRPPSARSESASPEDFSAMRAVSHVRAIANEPRPIGSAAHSRARDYIFNQLTAIGLSPEVQNASSINQHRTGPFIGARVENVVAVLKGTDSVNSVLLAAHYDSVPTSLGASDDGAGVATLLEVSRCLRAGQPLKNDVVFLFTDGEELGLLGARAFVKEHPLANGVGLVLNFEARGNSGPSLMFETSDRNKLLVGLLAEAASRSVANSLMGDIYKLLPNDTDFTVFKKAGLPGLNFSYINGSAYYHTLRDSCENLDIDSLQHHGDYALALSRHFQNSAVDLSRQSDVVYFDLLTLTLVQYPRSWTLPLSLLAVLLLILVVASGLKRKKVTYRGLLRGLLALMLALILMPIAVTGSWRAIQSLSPALRANPVGDSYNSDVFLVGLMALSLAFASAVFIWFGKRTTLLDLTAGVMTGWVVLTVLVGLLLQGGSYLLVWPSLFGLVGLALVIISRSEDSSVRNILLLSLGPIAGVLLLAPVVYLTAVGLTLRMAGLAMPLAALLVALIAPHLTLIAEKRQWLLPALSASAAIIILAVGLTISQPGVKQPGLNHVFYAYDSDTGDAVWASADTKLDEWTSQFFGAEAEQTALRKYFPGDTRKFITSPAPVAALEAPIISSQGEETSNGRRTLRLRISSPRQAPAILLYLDPSTDLRNALIGGKSIADKADNFSIRPGLAWILTYFALPKEGLELILDVGSSAPLTIHILDWTYELPQGPGIQYRTRPDNYIPSPLPFSDATIVAKTFTL